MEPINVLDELRRQQQATAQQTEGLTQRLQRLDQISTTVDPMVRQQLMSGGGGPLYNPLDGVQGSQEFSEQARNRRAAASSDLAANRQQNLSLLQQIGSEQRRGGAGGTASSKARSEVKDLADLLGLTPAQVLQQRPDLAAAAGIDENLLQGLGQLASDPLTEAVASGDIALNDIKDVDQRARIANSLRQQGRLPQEKGAQEALTAAKSLQQAGTGGITGFFKEAEIFGTPIRAEQAVTSRQLASLLSLDQIEKLKGSGAISDREGAILQAAASDLGIDPETGKSTLSQKKFDEKLQKLINGLEGESLGVQDDPLGIL